MEVIVLPLLFELGELRFDIHPCVIKQEKELILIDAGYPGFLPRLERAFQENGLEIENLTQLVLTHHDHDHMGAARALKEKYPGVRVRCSEQQLPYVLGERKSLRLQQAERLGADADFINMLKSVEPVAFAEPLKDGGQLCAGVRVIETPGHMPGHLSVYLEPLKTLVSGDFLVCEEGVLAIAQEAFVLDKQEELASLQKVSDMPIEKVICYHGGEYSSSHMRKELEDLAQKGYSKE